ncbi:MAG: ABC transporter permease, partial [Chthoniobacterales bacterium]
MTELRFALRQLTKSPSFTLVAVLALALGIGANTAIFSVVNTVLLKPLPFRQAEQLIALGAVDKRSPRVGHGADSISYPDFVDFRAQSRSFAHLAVHHDRTYALAGAAQAQSLRGQRVSADFFQVLGAAPEIGRTFRLEEELAGGGPIGYTVVISHAVWERQFKSAPNALGSVLILDGQPHTVIGVMPRGFQFPIQPEALDIYTTIAAEAVSSDGDPPATEQRGNHSWQGIGRLKPGVSLAQGEAELSTIAARLERQYPDTNSDLGARISPLREELVGDVSGALYVLFAAVGCVLLIAIANVANLLLARATVRAKEMALRSALGASRGRIVRQLLTESVVLSALGGLLGLLCAAWGTDLLVRLVPQNIPRSSEIRLDGTVLAFTCAISLATGVLFGLAPAFQAARLDLQSALQESGRGGSPGGRVWHRLRSGLVIAEIALALLLLTSAGLLLQSFARLSRVDPGLRPERIFTAFISLPETSYPRPDDVKDFFNRLLPRLSALPGVQAASTILPMPLSGSNITASFDLAQRPMPKGQQPDSPMRIAGVDYFQTMGIPLLRGRTFDQSDQRNAPPAVVINQRFAEKFFPGENPIGQHITPGMSADPGEPPLREIVGVVGNVRHRSLRAEVTPEMYLPATQSPSSQTYLVVRTSMAEAASFAAAVRAEVAHTDADVVLTSVRVFDDYLARSLARPRFNALLLAIFAGVALLLTAIGIYGVMAYSVA